MHWDRGTGLPSPYTAAIEEIATYFERKPGVTDFFQYRSLSAATETLVNLLWRRPAFRTIGYGHQVCTKQSEPYFPL
jgi:hypothetical protein